MGCVQSFRELCDRQKNTNVRLSLPAVCFVWQIAMIILFGVFIRYNEESSPFWIEHRKAKNISSDIENDFYFRYPSKWLHLDLFLSVSHTLSSRCLLSDFLYLYCTHLLPYLKPGVCMDQPYQVTDFNVVAYWCMSMACFKSNIWINGNLISNFL